jgi:hypothetical protein
VDLSATLRLRLGCHAGAAECLDGDCDGYDQGMPKRHQPTPIVAIIVPQVDDIHEGLATLTHFANFNAGL